MAHNEQASVSAPPVNQGQRKRPKGTCSEYQGMILKPDASPISEEQLAAEIRGIYDGLVTVETKCIDIDAALASDKAQLDVEQWQTLIALHRTLLYEHHDFLMATQHPSTPDELKCLATKYCMPARMWKHGVHAFLEVLRHRRPDSQDYMLAFVTLAYQMMALLFETVPCFTDTWIECQGDLARYRMAIEGEDYERHTLLEGVAARWYTMASDRHPVVGRLYHHLGILERPSIRKLASYAKSLTCSIPFLNARDSMATFCKPIVQEEHLTKVDRDWARMKKPKARSKHSNRKKTTVDGHKCSIGAGFRGSPCSDSGSEGHTRRMETPGLLESGPVAGRAGGDLDVARSWTAAFSGPVFVHSEGRTTWERRQKYATIPIGKPLIDFGMGWCSTGTNVLEKARQAFVEAADHMATLCLSSMDSRTWWPLLIFSGLKTVTGHPVADLLTATQETSNSNFSHWILPLIMLLLALARGCWHVVTPEEDLTASSPKTTYEVVSALGSMVVEAANEHDQGTNWTISGAWLFWSLGNQVRRHRLTRKKYRERYITLMLPSGALLAFLVAATMVRLTGSGSITRQWLDALPLGLSLSAWSLHALWSDPVQEAAGARRESRSSGETASTELDNSSSRAPQIRSRSLNRGSTVSDPGDPRLEEQRVVHHRGGA